MKRRPGEDSMTYGIKRKLEGYTPEYNPEAWERLVYKLDKDVTSGNKLSFRSWLFGLILGLSISFGLGYMLFNKLANNRQKELSGKISELRNELDILKKNMDSTPDIKQGHLSNEEGRENISARLEPGIKIIKSYALQNYSNQQLISGGISYSSANEQLLFKQNIVSRFNKKYYRLSFMQPGLFFADSAGLEEVKCIPFDNSRGQSLQANKEKKKNKKRTIEWPSVSFNLKDDMYKHLMGPDKLYIGYNPELVYGNYQSKAASLKHNLGIDLSGPVSKKLTVSGGVHWGTYSWVKKYSRGHFENADSSAIDTLSGFEIWITDSLYNLHADWRYLEVPVHINYKLFENNNSSFYLSAGISMIFSLQEKYKTEILENNAIETYHEKVAAFNKYYIPANFDVGIIYNYSFSDRWSLNIYPHYTRNLKSLGFKNINYSAWGLHVRLCYRFKKEIE